MWCYAEYHYVELFHAVCCYAEFFVLCIIMLILIIPSVTMPSLIMRFAVSVVVLSVDASLDNKSS